MAFNPAGITGVRNNVTVGMTPINVQSSYVDRNNFGTTYETSNDWRPAFNAYAVWGPEDSKFKFGIGSYTPFGGGYDWGDTWAGANELISLDLAAIFIQPTVAYKVSDQISVGASFIYAIGNVNLQRRLPVNFADGSFGRVELDSDANGIGFSAGVQWDPTEDWGIGASYRSLITMEASGGTADFTVPTSARGTFPEGNTFNADLPLPAQASIGVAYKGFERWVVELDVNYIFWSEYESLDFEFSRNPQTLNSSSLRNYDDAIAIRLGAQYALIEDKLDVRAGGYYSLTPIKDGFVTPESPDADRVSLHAGLSWHLNEKITIDGAFQYLRALERDDYNPRTGLDGTWNTQAFLPSVSLTYNFGE